MRRTIQCPLLYLIVIHVVVVLAIVAIVAPWFGFRLSKVRVDKASVFLVESGWWGDDWKEFAEWSGAGSLRGRSLDPLRARFVRVRDANGDTVASMRFDAQGQIDYISVVPPGLQTIWSFTPSGDSTSGWAVATWVTDNPDIGSSPNATFDRFTLYLDRNATGVPDEKTVRAEPYPAPVRKFRLKRDAWEEVLQAPSEAAMPSGVGDAEGERDQDEQGPSGATDPASDTP